MPLAGAIDDTHSSAADLLQNLVITQSPLCVRHIRFGENALEKFCGSFSLGFQSFFQETIYTGRVAEAHCSTALPAFNLTLLRADDRVGEVR